MVVTALLELWSTCLLLVALAARDLLGLISLFPYVDPPEFLLRSHRPLLVVPGHTFSLR